MRCSAASTSDSRRVRPGRCAWVRSSRWTRSGTRASPSISTRRSRAFRSLRDGVETIADRLSQSDDSERRAQILVELRGALRRLDAISDGLNRTLRPAGGGVPTVRWIERTTRGQHVQLSAVPLDLAPVLRELLFDRLNTVVLTSATLAASGEFDFLESRLGLAGELVSGHRAPDLRLALRLSRPNASSGFPPTCRSPARTRWAMGRRWCKSCRIWRMPRTAACSCCSPATPPCGGPPRSSGWRWGRAGRSWFRGRPLGTSSCAGFARRRTPFCSAPIRSGKGWMCPGARSAPW